MVNMSIGDYIAEAIEKGLSSQAFLNWYNTKYEKFNRGDEDCVNREEIIEDIKRIFDIEY